MLQLLIHIAHWILHDLITIMDMESETAQLQNQDLSRLSHDNKNILKTTIQTKENLKWIMLNYPSTIHFLSMFHPTIIRQMLITIMFQGTLVSMLSSTQMRRIKWEIMATL